MVRRRCCCKKKTCGCNLCSDIKCLLGIDPFGNPDERLLLQLEIDGIANVTGETPCEDCENANITVPLLYADGTAIGMFEVLGGFVLPQPDRLLGDEAEGCTWGSEDFYVCNGEHATSTMEAGAALYRNTAGGVSWYAYASLLETSVLTPPFANQIIWEAYGSLSSASNGRTRCKEIDATIAAAIAFQSAEPVFCGGNPTFRLRGLAA